MSFLLLCGENSVKILKIETGGEILKHRNLDTHFTVVIQLFANAQDLKILLSEEFTKMVIAITIKFQES